MMNVNKQNVQLLNVKSVNNSIQLFLDQKGERSVNTMNAYRNDIETFFRTMLGKELSQLTVNDLSFNKEDILNYRKHLKNLTKEDGTPKYKNSSINRFIASIESMFIELDASGYEDYVHLNAFSRIDKLPENDTKNAGELTDEEFELFEQTALQLENGRMKSLMIGLAGRTSIRLSAILKLKWSDIKRIDHGDHKGLWLVNAIDKGNKKDSKPIMDSFYQRLLEIKVEGVDRIFTFSDTTVNNMINRICKLLNIDDDRNITFHSLKGLGINIVTDSGGSMEDARRQGNHSNIATTSARYLRRTKDYSKYAGVIIDSKLDTSALDTLDKDQLLALIKGTNKNIQRQIMNGYKEGKHNV